MSKKLDQFHLTFIGEDVEILSSIKTYDESENVIPLVIYGILMEIDDDFFYIGTGENINRAVKRNSVEFIAIVEPFDPVMEILEQIPKSKKNEAN
jgi:hypothetical protein